MGAAILTDLSLRLRTDSVELSKGLERAKGSLNTFKKDTRQASRQIKGVFGELGGAAASGFSRMGAGFGAMQSALNGSIRAVKGLTGGMNGLKMAIISTGIGAIFVAMGTAVAGLMAYFKGTTDGARKLAGITGTLKGLFTGLKEVLINVGRFLVQMFEDPKEAIASLWEMIKTNLVNRFIGMVQMFKSGWSAISNGAKAVGLAVGGIFNEEKRAQAKKYFAQMQKDIVDTGKAAGMMATGVDIADKLEKAKDKLEEIKETGRASAKVEQARHDLYMKNTDFLITQAKLVNEIATLTDISSDKELDALVSLKATNDAMLVSRDLYNQRISLQDEAVKLKREEMSLGSNTKEDERELNELIAARIVLQKEATDKERELKNRREEINARIKAQETKDEAAKNKEILEAQKLTAATEKALLDSQENYRKQVLGRTLEGEISLLEETLAAKLIAEEDYNSERARLQDEISARDKQLAEEEIQTAKDKKDAKIAAALGYMDAALQGTAVVSQMFEAAKNKELAAAGDNEEKKAKIELKYAKRQKALSIVQAVINTAQGVTKAFAQGGILGMITGGIVAASGLAQISTIRSTPLAKGGIAYSPVNALVGEYAGARSNPEVIAPLDKLKSILGGTGGGRVVFEIAGTNLVGILNKQAKIDSNF